MLDFVVQLLQKKILNLFLNFNEIQIIGTAGRVDVSDYDLDCVGVATDIFTHLNLAILILTLLLTFDADTRTLNQSPNRPEQCAGLLPPI